MALLTESPSSVVQTARVSLSAAQLLASNVTRITVVAAPGAGKVISPLNVVYGYHFNTIPYQCDPALVGAAQIKLYLGATALGGFWSSNTPYLLIGNTSNNQGFDPGTQNYAAGSGFVNAALSIGAVNPLTWGAILTSVKNAGGAAYVAGDTGIVNVGSADATYVVDTVAAGAVATYHLTSGGTAYNAPTVGAATATGGAQPGIGVGFTVDINSVAQGDGTLTAEVQYIVVPL